MKQNSNKTPATTNTTMANFLSFPKTRGFLEATLGEKKGEFISNLIALTDADDKLAECDPGALMKCAMNATSLNLPLNKNLGYAYVIPYKGVPSFQIGYKGFIQLAIRTCLYQTNNATDIREGEITRNKITAEITFHKENPEGKVIGYLAYLKLITGFTSSLYMSEAEIEAHAVRFSKAYGYDKQKKTRVSVWSDPANRPKMALKTVLKGLLGTYGLMTNEMAKAYSSDSNVEKEDGERYVDAEVIPQEDPKKKEDADIKKIQL